MTQQYRHFKGNLYTLMNVGFSIDDGEFYAIYKRSDNSYEYGWGYARHSETEEIYAIESSGNICKAEAIVPASYHDHIRQEAIDSGLWIRPLEMFFDYKEVDGKMVRRFERIS